MTQKTKIAFIKKWCKEQGLELTLEGECGFGRECVGILDGTNYIDYAWYDEKYNRIDQNGDVWTPEDAYHKHHCTAVLGRGDAAIDQLYEWVKYFKDENFTYEKVPARRKSEIEMLLYGPYHHRLVRH